jgi:hypothetical protein
MQMPLTEEQIKIVWDRVRLWSAEAAAKGMMPVVLIALEPGPPGVVKDGDVMVSDDLSADDVRKLLQTLLMNLPNVAGGPSPVKN